jgi:hypothetical protein
LFSGTIKTPSQADEQVSISFEKFIIYTCKFSAFKNEICVESFCRAGSKELDSMIFEIFDLSGL